MTTYTMTIGGTDHSFNVKNTGEYTVISHPIWNLSGIGETFETAVENLKDEIELAGNQRWLHVPDSELTDKEIRMKQFIKTFISERDDNNQMTGDHYYHTIEVGGEKHRFNVEHEDDYVIISHDKWNLSGIGETFETAVKDLKDKIGIIGRQRWIRLPDSELNDEETEIKRFVQAYLSEHGEDSYDPKQDQPDPETNENQTDVTTEVVKDLEKRAEYGKEQYGTRLKSNNGRDALLDAYEEALDLCVYLKQELIERG